jgi:hypothetical protein
MFHPVEQLELPSASTRAATGLVLGLKKGLEIEMAPE